MKNNASRVRAAAPFFIAECAWMYSLLILNYLYLHADFAHNPVVLCATWGVVHCDPEWTRHTSSLLPRTRLIWCVTTAIPNGRDTHLLCLCLLYFCGASYDAPRKLTSGIGNQWLHFLSARDAWRIVIRAVRWQYEKQDWTGWEIRHTGVPHNNNKNVVGLPQAIGNR